MNEEESRIQHNFLLVFQMSVIYNIESVSRRSSGIAPPTLIHKVGDIASTVCCSKQSWLKDALEYL